MVRQRVTGQARDAHQVLDELWMEIERRVGDRPAFFRAAEADATTARAFFEVTRLSYLDAPIPTDFKNVLFTYLSRFCESRYCLARHSALLLGREEGPEGNGHAPLNRARLLMLLREPTPEPDALAGLLQALERHPAPLPDWPDLFSPLGAQIRAACAVVFLDPHGAGAFIEALRRLFGAQRLEQLLMLLGFVRTAHFWTMVHPGLAPESDVEARLTLDDEVRALIDERLHEATRFRLGQRLHEELLALRAADEEARWLQQLTDAMPALIAHVDASLRYTFVNEAYTNYLGSRREDILGRHVRDVLGEDNYARIAPKLAIAMRDGTVRFETRIVRPSDGHTIYLSVHLNPDRRADGVVRGVFVLALDMSERRAYEESLRAHEERFRHLANAVPQLVWTARADGTVDYYNDRYADYGGIQPSEDGAWTWAPALHEDDVQPTVRAWEHAVRTGEPYQCQHRVRMRDGEYRWHLSRAVPARDAKGRVTRWFGTATDIDASKRTEEALRASEARQKAIVETAVDGIVTMSERGEIESVNPAMERIFGYSSEELLGQNVAILMPEPFHSEHDAYLERYARTGERRIIGIGREVRGRRKSGAEFPVDLAVSETRLGERRIYIGIVRDITQRKAAEEALLEADRRKDEFLAILAHELRNPLNPIKNAVELLRLRGQAEPELVWGRSVITRQVDNLSRLVEDLLDVSRISRGSLELRRERLSLVTVVDEALVASRPLIEQRRQTLTVELPAEPLVLDADVVRLTQVFLNLLNNAAKYTPDGGEISVRAARVDDHAEVRVKDNGVGIAAEQLPHLFDMFYQADRGVERSHGGLGIGLTLVRRLVEMHGGSVSVLSGGIGQGAEFVVRLPIAAGEASVRAAGEDVPHAVSPPQRILVVDDNEDSAEMLAALLSFHGSEVRAVHDGATALEVAEQWRPQVILLDIGMPRMSGYDVCRRLREQAWGRGMVVIAQTGWGSQEDRKRSLEAGFDLHLTKPVDPGTLLRILAELPNADG